MRWLKSWSSTFTQYIIQPNLLLILCNSQFILLTLSRFIYGDPEGVDGSDEQNVKEDLLKR